MDKTEKLGNIGADMTLMCRDRGRMQGVRGLRRGKSESVSTNSATSVAHTEGLSFIPNSCFMAASFVS